MARPTTSTVPSALDNAPAPASDSNNGGKAQAATAGATENGGSSPAAADVARSPSAASKTRRRSSASLVFSSVAPAFDASTALPAPVSGALPRPPAPPTNTSATTTTTSPPGARSSRSALHSSMASGPASPTPAGPARRGSSRASSAFGERASTLERCATEALEMTGQLQGEIAAVEEQVLRVERELEDAQRAVASGGSYRGKEGGALDAEEERLARKERLLREKEGQLREERLMRLRSRSYQQRRGSEVAAARPRRVSFITTQAFPDDPEGERAERQRLAQVEGVASRRQSISDGGDSRRQSISNVGGPEGVSNVGGPESVSNVSGSGRDLLDDFDAGDHSSVLLKYPMEEDKRLMVRMQAFHQPVLVGTLLSGFALVLFDVATTHLARRLAVLAFALEISSSIVLCLIMFMGQQVYSQATGVKPLARKFLERMRHATILSLVMFSLGVVAFVVSFVVEASDEMGDSWLAIFAIILCPTALATILFAVSTEQVRRGSAASYRKEPAPAPVRQ